MYRGKLYGRVIERKSDGAVWITEVVASCRRGKIVQYEPSGEVENLVFKDGDFIAGKSVPAADAFFNRDGSVNTALSPDWRSYTELMDRRQW